MPNWCYNTLTVSGKDEDIKAFKTRAKGDKTDLSLDSLYPMPVELKDSRSPADVVPDAEYPKKLAEAKKLQEANKGNQFYDSMPISESESRRLIMLYGSNNWYDWRIGHWGCKWDVQAELVRDEPRKLEYIFDSPWSPPINWLERVSIDFPKLRFKIKYEEEGMGFRGITWFTKGEMKERYYGS